MEKQKSKIKVVISMLLIGILLVGCGSKTVTTDKVKKQCTIEVECKTILNNKDKLDKNFKKHIPKDGIILKKQKVTFYEGDSVYDILKKQLKNKNILMESSFTAGSAYVEGIDNIYEFSCGELSGWQYSVNGKYIGKSCSEYYVKQGDSIQWRYTCELGEDLK